jgi:hypothetical protein
MGSLPEDESNETISVQYKQLFMHMGKSLVLKSIFLETLKL